jgi:hypothetical protein
MIERKRANNAPGQGADVKNWVNIFDYLAESSKVLQVSEIAQGLNIPEAEVRRALISLSIHTIPLYEEKRGHNIFFGLLRDLSREQFFGLIGWEVPEWAVTV